MAKTQHTLLSVIVISYNTAKLTVQCLESVIKDISGSAKLQQHCEILVVDNHSTDNSVAVIEKLAVNNSKLLPIKLIKNQSNFGFAQANNQAMKKALGEYFLLLNSDTIVQKGALTTMINLLTSDHNPKLGLVAASLWNADGSYQPQGGDQISLLAAINQWLMLDDLPFIGKYLPTLQKRQSHPPANQPLQLMGWVSGTALCFSRQLYQSVGGFNQSIFMYAEDMEFCLRARGAGWGSAIAHEAKITHFGSSSSSANQAKLGEVRGLLKFWPKYFGELSTRILKLIIFVGACQRLVLFALLGRQSQASVYKLLLQQLYV